MASKVTGEALVGKSLAPFGRAHLKIVGILPTNLPAIETNELRLGNLFLLSDGSVAIIGILTFSDKIVDEEYGRRIKELMAMTLVERLIFEDGWNAGKKEGQREMKRYSGLTLSLLSEKKYKDLEKASKNAEYRKKLYRKYGL